MKLTERGEPGFRIALFRPPFPVSFPRRQHPPLTSLPHSSARKERVSVVAMSFSGRFGRLAIAVSFVALCALLGSGLYLGSSTLDSIVPSPASWKDKGLGSSKPKGNDKQAVDFPYPKKIWQTDKSLEVKPQWKPLVSSWFEKNPTFRYELLNDYGAENYVRERFADQPKIRDAYLNTPDVILRADMLRIMLMWASGGVYSDMDTECLVPITEWVPKEYYGRANLVVGFETERSRDFVEGVTEEQRMEVKVCQWTLLSMAKNKHVFAIIDHIIDNMHRIADSKGVTFEQLGEHLEIPEVISATGPAEVTIALLESLSHTLNETIDRRNVSGYLEPFLLDDVLFLPVNAFAGHQTHSHSGSPELGPLLVRHYYGSSWWESHS
jgi:mannosyltransferase OCH1-like enzyme